MRDVIVIGGGPAGSTAATLLAQQGFSVTLLERERFPRFQIGESLLPYFSHQDNRFRLALFFFLVKLQKWRGVIAPRIAWETLPAAASATATLRPDLWT
jgi:glycine/D-amino acid oxidase-like deaminating enzyme